MSHKQKTLWTKDFTSITIATILTAVGGEAMNLPISLLVFDETGSTFLSALVLICGVLPDVVLSVLAAPLIDKGGKKKWIVGLDILTAVLYAMMGLYISVHAFNYLLYLIFVLAVGTISVFYQRRKVKDFFIKFTKKSHFADFLTKHTLDFVLHCLFCGLAEMDTDDIGGLANLLSDSRASGGVGCGIVVHSKSSCK